MLKINKTIGIVRNLIGGIIIGMFLTNSIFAANTATFSASCYMPHYATMSDGEQVLADNVNNEVEQINNPQEEQGAKTENETALIQQQEEVVLEGRVEVINTVSAR